jgi:hypothetical protein
LKRDRRSPVSQEPDFSFSAGNISWFIKVGIIANIPITSYSLAVQQRLLSFRIFKKQVKKVSTVYRFTK